MAAENGRGRRLRLGARRGASMRPRRMAAENIDVARMVRVVGGVLQ